MIVLKTDRPQKFDLHQLQTEAKEKFGIRYIDLNEVGDQLAVYLEDGKAEASEDVKADDLNTFTETLSDHDPDKPKPAPKVRDLSSNELAQLIERIAILNGLAASDGTLKQG